MIYQYLINPNFIHSRISYSNYLDINDAVSELKYDEIIHIEKDYAIIRNKANTFFLLSNEIVKFEHLPKHLNEIYQVANIK